MSNRDPHYTHACLYTYLADQLYHDRQPDHALSHIVKRELKEAKAHTKPSTTLKTLPKPLKTF